jgi:UDP-galactopyranose mutase
MKSVLVVGAGMAGAVHARELADAGHSVRVIDKRPHIAGNCFDAFTDEGVRVHRYGPHLFHTSNGRVFDWLSRFTGWLSYEHRVKARLEDGRLVPMPVNLTTINALFGKDFTTKEEVSDFLATKTEDRGEIVSAEDWLYANMGAELTELFFRPYTEKMWDLKLAEVDPAIVKRVQLRYDNDDRYFSNDTIQAMPTDGFTAMFERMLDHPDITVAVDTAFDKAMLADHDFCFNSMPIDEYFDYSLGELPYRSIRFHNTVVPVAEAASHVVINYTDHRPFTRETWWHLIPGHVRGTPTEVVRTVEEPCDYLDNARERYYPVKASDGRYDALYRRYQALAEGEPGLEFIGRCGTYQYLDMHQVVNQSLMGVGRWLEANPAG